MSSLKEIHNFDIKEKYLYQIIVFFLRIYQNMEKAALHSVFVALQVITSVTMSLLFVWYFKMSYMGMIYGSFVGALVSCVFAGVHFNRHVRIRFSRKILLENLKYGIQVIPKSFTGFINKFFDKYMLNAMLSMSVVGVYTIGQTIITAIDMLMSNIWMSFQPVSYREVFDNGKGATTKAPPQSSH